MYAREPAVIATPLGLVRVEAGEVVERVTIGVDAVTAPGAGLAREAARQIDAYFRGALRQFDLPLMPAATPRGEVLRAAIVGIAFGAAASYGELAQRHGSSARAIGQACARNPLPLLVPCHRVLASTGLGFYSAGEGVTTKRSLLDHERAATESAR